MSVADLLERAALDGVAVVVRSDGTVEVTGDQRAVGRWLPALRKHKAAIAQLLPEVAAMQGDIEAISAWLTMIGEPDPETVADVISQCRADPEAREYFRKRACCDLPAGTDAQ